MSHETVSAVTACMGGNDVNCSDHHVPLFHLCNLVGDLRFGLGIDLRVENYGSLSQRAGTGRRRRLLESISIGKSFLAAKSVPQALKRKLIYTAWRHE